MAEVFVVAAVLVAIAELGDKTQVLSMMLATRYPARRVFLGVLLAVLALQFIAAAAGRAVGDVVPAGVLAFLTSGLFVAFGVWSFIDATRDGIDEEIPDERGRAGLGPVLAVAAAFFVAELGDKTQILTFTVAADPGIAGRTLSALGLGAGSQPEGAGLFVAVWLGSALGMMVVNGLAILAGAVVGRRFSRAVVGRVSGVVFILFGLGALLSYLLGG